MSYTLQMLISIKIRSVSPNSRSWESWLKLLRELSDLDLKIAFLLTDSYDVGQRPLRPHCGKSTTRNETGKSNNKDPKKPNVGSDNPFPLGLISPQLLPDALEHTCRLQREGTVIITHGMLTQLSPLCMRILL